MMRTVEMPVWALVLIVAFAAVTFASHFLFPSVRWFFRRRMERAVAELNKRLTRPIEPFKLARRYDMVQRLTYDAEVTQAIREHCAETGEPERVGYEMARRYAREIVPRFSAFMYFGFAALVSRVLSKGFYRMRVGAFDREMLDTIDKDATVVFVMNHRSNMDYVLITWLALKRSHLSYAVGEWARVWPLSALIRATGAYFIRRKSRNALYRKVLARYVQMASEGGVTQGIFPEGGLSLNGAVGEPKLGLLSYFVEGFRPGLSRDVVFVPVAINYDRVIEDRALVSAGVTGRRKFRMRLVDVVRHLGVHMIQRLTGRFKRFGFASVQAGQPLSLSEFAEAHMGEVDTRLLARQLMARIRASVPVLPAPLAAGVILGADGLTQAEISERFGILARDMQARGAHLDMPQRGLEYAAQVGVSLLMLRKVITERDGRYYVIPEERGILAYYARSVAHLVSDEAQSLSAHGFAAT
ncbi:MAG: 1-acyl-sn-glycerol-3-phosphate acyltransferase [Maritimibacter sp.]